MRREFLQIEEDGFYGAYYPNIAKSNKAIIVMLGDAVDDRLAVSGVKWLQKLGCNVLAMSPTKKDYGHHRKAFATPLPVPGKLILVSPGMVAGADVALREEMERISQYDPMLGMGFMDAMAEIMQLSQDQNDYFSAPFGADFNGFPPVHILSGTFEIFHAQIPSIVQQIKAAGVPVSLYPGEKMMHIWPYIPFSRECKEALSLIFHIIENEN